MHCFQPVLSHLGDKPAYHRNPYKIQLEKVKARYENVIIIAES